MDALAGRICRVSNSIVVCFALCFVATVSDAQSTPPQPSSETAQPQSQEEATHAELRALRDALLEAWQHRDLDGLLKHVAPNVVVTWQNGEVSRGPDGLRKFYDEVLNGPDRVVANIASTLKVDELSILYGNETAIAFGSIHDELTLNRSIARAAFLGAGNVLPLDSRWTASLVKIGGEWKLASYHVSTDAFSNPILSKAVAAGERSALFAGVGGLIVGGLAAWFFIRRGSGNIKTS
jgi:ketosteroid isomerase-like protein